MVTRPIARPQQENNSAHHSFYSKLPYIVLGGTAAATAIALYYLSGSDKDESAVASQNSYPSGLALFSGFLAAGQALLAESAAKIRIPTFSPNDPLARLSDRVEYFNSPLPEFSDEDFFDTVENLPIRKRGSDISDRPLMFPKGNEYLLHSQSISPITTAAQYASVGLDNGKVAYVFHQQSGYLYLEIKDETGKTLDSVYIYSNVKNPTISKSNGKIYVAYQNGNLIREFIYNPTTRTSTSKLNLVAPNQNYNCRPIIKGLNNGNHFLASMYDGKVAYKVYDSKTDLIGLEISFPTTDKFEGAVALGPYADNSTVMLYEQSSNLATTDLSARYLDSKGSPFALFSLGKCYAPKAETTANDIIFTTCLNTEGVQGFGVGKSQDKIIPQFTISPNALGGYDSHALAASPNQKWIVSHYIGKDKNAYFKIFENAMQIGSESQSNVNSDVSFPSAAFVQDDTLVLSYLRGGFVYGRTFQVNTPPIVVDTLPSQNATVGTLFTFQIPNGTWFDPDGHPLIFSAECADQQSLDTTWLNFFPNNLTFSGVPPQGSQGPWMLNAIGDDSYLNGKVPTPFQINVINRNPVLGALPSHDLRIGTPFSLQLNATDPDGDPPIFSSTSLPNQTTLTEKGSFFWIPATGQQGIYNIPILVEDGFGGHDNGVITLKVLNQPPSSSTIPPRNFTANVLITFNLPPFVDLDGDKITYTAEEIGREDLPSWASFTPEGFLSGTPSNQAIGPFRLNFTGNDGHGGIAWTIGDFEIVAPTTSIPQNNSKTSFIVLASGVAGIASAILGCVYKIRQQQIDAWFERNIKPYCIKADQKVHGCMDLLCCRNNANKQSSLLHPLNNA
jgi:Bacterial Ig domain/Putative Ig domain